MTLENYKCDLHTLLCPGAEVDPYKTPVVAETPPRQVIPPDAESPDYDPGGPYLMIDLFPLDFDKPGTAALEDPPWERILSNHQIVAVVLKAMDGVSYHPVYQSWFVRNFKRVIELIRRWRGARRFAGGYHYLQAQVDGDAQGVAYVSQLWQAGWGVDDVVGILDAERGNVRSSNFKASRQQWIDNSNKFVARVRQETGRGVMFYGRNVLDDFSISSLFGCDRVWNPSYTRYMVTEGLVGKLPNGQSAACTLDDIGWWQCIGDGDGDPYAHHIPLILPEIGQGVDLSVCIDGPRAVTMKRVRKTLL